MFENYIWLSFSFEVNVYPHITLWDVWKIWMNPLYGVNNAFMWMLHEMLENYIRLSLVGVNVYVSVTWDVGHIKYIYMDLLSFMELVFYTSVTRFKKKSKRVYVHMLRVGGMDVESPLSLLTADTDTTGVDGIYIY
jgi:hypothetical protein